jgi:phospholipase A1
MTTTLIFLPGTLGSKLALNGIEIWPPVWEEIFDKYRRIDELLDPRVVSTGIVERVVNFIPIYEQLVYDLEEICRRTHSAFEPFHYDWRKDIRETAHALGARIEDSVNSGASSIVLVCHSMGGLVARLMLENRDNWAKPWFSKIRRLVAICSPHLGAPSALLKTLGLEGSSPISADDIKRITADHRYPSGYQLLPAPGVPVLYDEDLTNLLNIYDHGDASSVRLDLTNLDVAKATWSEIDINNRPRSVQYISIAGEGHSTANRLIKESETEIEVWYDTPGDGTVPLYSADLVAGVRYVTHGDHIGIFTVFRFRRILYLILEGSSAMPQMVEQDKPGVTISINKRVFLPSEQIDLVVIPDNETGKLSGELIFTKAGDLQATQMVPYAIEPLEYNGPRVSSIPVSIAAPSDTGAYRLSFRGTHLTTNASAAAFIVSKTGGTQRRLL